MRTLRENQRVSYELQQDRRGKMAATNLKAADDAAESEAEPEQASDEGQPE
jgi:CspA family cold shock protein